MTCSLACNHLPLQSDDFYSWASILMTTANLNKRSSNCRFTNNYHEKRLLTYVSYRGTKQTYASSIRRKSIVINQSFIKDSSYWILQTVSVFLRHPVSCIPGISTPGVCVYILYKPFLLFTSIIIDKEGKDFNDA